MKGRDVEPSWRSGLDYLHMMPMKTTILILK